jgi:macrolide transport system ATP-binding/permease protein
MNCLRVLMQRLLALFRTRRLEQDLDEELRAHLEMLVEENRRKGIPPEEARYAALRSFGGVDQVKETCRDKRGCR